MTGPVHDDTAWSGKLIAIVDDEPLVRSATSSLLRALGFDCEVFACAEDLLRYDLNTLRCVLSDIQMPAMTGVALAQRLGERAPRLPIILMSAYANDAAQALLASGRIAALLDKPLDGDLLQVTIEDALGADRAA